VLGEVDPAERPETEGALGDGAHDAFEVGRTVPPPGFAGLPPAGGETEPVTGFL
jgi:hypothetical protein